MSAKSNSGTTARRPATKKTLGRPRQNVSGGVVIVDRAKLRKLQETVNSLINDYGMTTRQIARYTIGERRSSYISAISRGKHLSKPPSIRPREDEAEHITRFRAFVVSQEGASGEVAELMLERFGLLGQVADLDARIYRALRRLGMRTK